LGWNGYQRPWLFGQMAGFVKKGYQAFVFHLWWISQKAQFYSHGQAIDLEKLVIAGMENSVVIFIPLDYDILCYYLYPATQVGPNN